MATLKKTFCMLLCVITCFFSFSISAQAAESDISPCYDYTRQTSSALGISNSGKATVSIGCTGLNSSVSKIKAETCLQRKVGLIWVKADIGTTNNVWTDTTTNYYLNASHSATLSKSGTYRAKTIFTVYCGSNSEKITVYSGTSTY